MHNDWLACQPIPIKVFDLKMEISNRSVLPSGWTMENHDSIHINPLISNAFKYAGFVEKFGTGIPKMLNVCKAGRNLESEYRIYEKSISLVLKPSEKYMLLVGRLYGRNSNASKQNANVGKDLGQTVSGLFLDSQLFASYLLPKVIETSMIWEADEIYV